MLKKLQSFYQKIKNLNYYIPIKKDSYNFRMWKKYYSGASGLMGVEN